MHLCQNQYNGRSGRTRRRQDTLRGAISMTSLHESTNLPEADEIDAARFQRSGVGRGPIPGAMPLARVAARRWRLTRCCHFRSRTTTSTKMQSRSFRAGHDLRQTRYTRQTRQTRFTTLRNPKPQTRYPAPHTPNTRRAFSRKIFSCTSTGNSISLYMLNCGTCCPGIR